MAHGPTVLTSDYIDQCLTQNTRLNPEDFLVKENKEDNIRGYKLADSLARAKTNKCRLLRGYTIYCTTGVRGGFGPYKDIVTENGGNCQLYKARASSAAPPIKDDGEDDISQSSTPEYLYLVSGTSAEEGKLWPKFRQHAHSQGRTARIVNPDWVLDLAIKQEIRWSDDYEIKG